jgi:hypothetical protein
VNTVICKLEHRYRPEFVELQDDQSYPPRHKCCGCAYEQGLIDGEAGKARNPQIDSWPVSQAGTVRHKSALEAYQLGYEKGLAVA